MAMQGLGFMGGGGGSSRSSSSSLANNTIAFNPAINVATAPTDFKPTIGGNATSNPTSQTSTSGGDTGGGATGEPLFGRGGGGSLPLDSILPTLYGQPGRLTASQIPTGAGAQPASDDTMMLLLLGGGALVLFMMMDGK